VIRRDDSLQSLNPRRILVGVRRTEKSGDYCPAVRENVMKIVPVIKSGDLERSLHFYTQVLDFRRKWPGSKDREMANGVIDLVRDGAAKSV